MKVFWLLAALAVLTKAYAEDVLVPGVPKAKPTTSFLPTDTAAADAAYAAAALALYHSHDPPVSVAPVTVGGAGSPAGAADPRAGPPLPGVSGGAQNLRFTPDLAGSVYGVGAVPLSTGPRRGPPGHSRRGNPHGGHPHAGNSGKPGRFG